MDNLCGFINIYKEAGYTSHDVVNIVRNNLNRVKTGHTGTLDPEATGVLPICIGKATKLSEYITSSSKEYRAEMTLGISTSTQDHTGEVIKKSNVNVSKEDINNAVLSFKGEIYQKPPMYSAVKINGKKLYELARQGKEIERIERKITIYDIKINDITENNIVIMTILCSKGTYIRTLCNDIGEKLGCGAHMSSLLRTKTGRFYIQDSINLNEFKECALKKRYAEIIIPVDKILCELRKVTVSNKAYKFLYNGNKINLTYLSTEPDYNENVLAYDSSGKLIGIYVRRENFLSPLIMLI